VRRAAQQQRKRGHALFAPILLLVLFFFFLFLLLLLFFLLLLWPSDGDVAHSSHFVSASSVDFCATVARRSGDERCEHDGIRAGSREGRGSALLL